MTTTFHGIHAGLCSIVQQGYPKVFSNLNCSFKFFYTVLQNIFKILYEICLKSFEMLKGCSLTD